MLGKKGKLLVAVLFIAAVLFNGEVRLRLDDIAKSFRDDFRQMLYLPRGNSLKIIACGFDAPLADALFIKGLVYYAEALDASEETKEATRGYSYALFDVITDLSPRFYRAYQVGGNLLGSSGDLETNMEGVRLLEKGVKYWDGLEEKGEKVSADPRWLFHIMQAVAFNLGIQSKRLQAGDNDGAAEARSRAREEFRLVASSPGVPPTIGLAAARMAGSGRAGGVEETAAAIFNVQNELYEAAVKRGDKEVAEDLARQLEESAKTLGDIRQTRGAEEFFSEVGREFAAKEGRPPEGLADLMKSGFLRAMPETLPFDTPKDPDTLLAMPDGSFLSRKLAALETRQYTTLLTDSAQSYRRAHGSPPPDLETLVATKFLERIPSPPLEAIGQRFEYNAEQGGVTSFMPLGPELPPERR